MHSFPDFSNRLKKKKKSARSRFSLVSNNLIELSFPPVDSLSREMVISADHRKTYNKCEMRGLCQAALSLARWCWVWEQPPALTGTPPRSASNTVSSLSLFPFPTHFLPGICDIFRSRSNEPLTPDCRVLLVYSCFPRTPRQDGKLNVQ